MIENDSWIINPILLKYLNKYSTILSIHTMVMSINITPIGYGHPYIIREHVYSNSIKRI